MTTFSAKFLHFAHSSRISREISAIFLHGKRNFRDFFDRNKGFFKQNTGLGQVRSLCLGAFGECSKFINVLIERIAHEGNLKNPVSSARTTARLLS
jgi:hypothetical protein